MLKTAIIRRCASLIAVMALAACETLQPGKPASAPGTKPQVPPTAPAPSSPPAVIPTPPVAPLPDKPSTLLNTLRASSWEAIPGWRDDDLAAAWSAFRASCGALKNHVSWQSVCNVALSLTDPSRDVVRQFFQAGFTPYQVINPDGTDQGLVTGYYEPQLRGSRTPTSIYRHPVYGVPDDLLIVDLGELYPELKSMRLRGRIDGRRVVPYFSRAQIESGAAAVKGKEIVWVDDAIELFFLQIQGSGRVRLENGEFVRVGYADQNGQPYRSIGRLLADRGEMPLERTSMQGIKAWAKQNPDKLQEVLNYNASYVFFRELPADLAGPLGALGVPLTTRRSVAVDPRYIPLGAPVFLATTMPNSREPLNQLMLAQDTGGAIRGAVRADFFWGFGDEAGSFAGRMRQTGRMWLLLPNEYPLAPPAGPQ